MQPTTVRRLWMGWFGIVSMHVANQISSYHVPPTPHKNLVFFPDLDITDRRVSMHSLSRVRFTTAMMPLPRGPGAQQIDCKPITTVQSVTSSQARHNPSSDPSHENTTHQRGCNNRGCGSNFSQPSWISTCRYGW